MKKMMMMAAVMGLVGTAGAAGTINASVKFKASVTNVCKVGTTIFNPVLNAGQFNAPAMSKSYNAGAGSGETTSTFNLPLTIECTKDTPLTVEATPDDGVKTTLLSTTGSYTTTTTPAAMKLTMGTNKLNGTYTLNSKKVASTGQFVGDKYTGGATFTADPGQWGAPASTPDTPYTGTLTFVISYN